MIVKKSYYDILFYLFKNTAMKARLVEGGDHDMWLLWIPEIQRMARMDDHPIYDDKIFIGMELRPDMLDRKTKYKWEIVPIEANENALICDRVRKC